jgi:hypothetical protein
VGQRDAGWLAVPEPSEAGELATDDAGAPTDRWLLGAAGIAAAAAWVLPSSRRT